MKKMIIALALFAMFATVNSILTRLFTGECVTECENVDTTLGCPSYKAMLEKEGSDPGVLCILCLYSKNCGRKFDCYLAKWHLCEQCPADALDEIPKCVECVKKCVKKREEDEENEH